MKPSQISKTPPPGWPSEKELRKMDKILEKAPATRMLPSNATPVEKFKYELCRQFVIYLNQNKQLSQRQLAKRLKTSEARVSEIVHYHLDKVTTDRLIGYLGIIRPGLEIKIPA